MKKALSVILSLIMVFSMFALGGVTSTAAEIDGEFGENLRWKYSEEDKVLWIWSKDGNTKEFMENYTYTDGSYNRPWEAFIDEIRMIYVNNVLSIGDYAFAGCKNLYQISLDYNNLTIIGQGAFQSCVNLRTFNIPKATVAIGPSAFEGCTNLEFVTMKRNVSYIGDNAFEGCPIEYTLYAGTPDQEDLIYFEDETERLKNVVHADAEYDVSVQVGEYQVLTAISLEPFTFKTKDANVATIIETEYGTVTEDGVECYYGVAAVQGKSNGITSIYALDNSGAAIGAFGVIVGRCASSHNMTKQYCLKEATCYCNEIIVYECDRCSHRVTEYHPKVPHSFVYETIVEADCVTKKQEVGVCTVCSARIQRETPALGHSIEQVSRTEPTCQAPGLHVAKCKTCGVEYKTELPQLEHNWTDWEITVPPTEETDGKKERHCTICEESQTEVILNPSALVGDVNGDGKVTAFDARMALQCAAGNIELDEHQLKLADVTGDGEITAIDARKILQIAANLI